MKTIQLLLLLCLTVSLSVAQTSTTLIANGATWRYSDKGTTPTSQTVGATVYNWTNLGYDDSSPTSWSAGPSELGYGDGDEQTVVTAKPPSTTANYITTYFRRTFTNPAILTHYRYKVRYIRDDGIVLYLNGIEIRRDGMPDGIITNSTPATLTVGNADESTWYEFYVPNGAVRQGNNVLAAEIHQVGPGSSDISFNAELIGEINTNTLVTSPLPITSATTTNWKYSDGGLDRGTIWRDLTYNDQYWQQTNIGSRVRMGYGETGDPNAGLSSINTAIANPFNANTYADYVSFGIDPGNKFPTTYFRKKVNISNPALAHELRFMRDDGIVIYINGVELPRDANGNTNNMPTGTATYPTPASAAADAAGETTWSNWQPVSSSLLVTGENIIAVEIHQITAFSSDITFNLEMRSSGIDITRGPYLQLGGQTAATIRWRTNVPTVGRVTYGLATNALSGTVNEPGSTTEHELRITDLQAGKTYFYSVGTTTMVLEQGVNNYFLTAPLADTKEKIRIASFGDCGSLDEPNNQANVRNGFLAYRGNTPTDLWMLIGDNSYDGADSQYQTNFFNPYKDTMLKNCMLYAVPGNHDYNGNSNHAKSRGGLVNYFPAFAYFENFTLPPTLNPHLPVPANTEEWYSFDYGPVHFVMLDSYGTQNIGGVEKEFAKDTLTHPQVQWLKADLAATTKKWKIVYMHYPTYSKGSHDSDGKTAPSYPGAKDEWITKATRKNINPILERFGVDLVITGHSHGYERSYPIHDQYDTLAHSNTININNHRFPGDESTGRYDGSTGSCAYKNTSEKKKQGTIYVVSGSAGAFEISKLGPHPVMVTDTSLRSKGGSFFMEVEDNRLDAKFLQASTRTLNPPGSTLVTDQFTIMKDVDIVQTLTITAGQSTTLTASFISDYVWSSPGNLSFTAPASRTVVVSPTVSQTFVVKDVKQCITDVFVVQVSCSGPLYSVKAGNWNDPTVWSCNRIPLSTDHVQVKHNILVPNNLQARALKVQFDPNTKLTYGANARLLLNQ